MTRIRTRSLAVAAAVGLSCLVGLPGTAHAASGESTLYAGQRLTAGQYLIWSRWKAIMQRDGNFVVYRDGRPCAATGTNGKGDSRSYIIMQADGNLVLYKYNHGPALWASGTNSRDFAGGWVTVGTQGGGDAQIILDTRGAPLGKVVLNGYC
jgi:hypothetical protein